MTLIEEILAKGYSGGDVQDREGWTLTILPAPTFGVKLSKGDEQSQLGCYPPESVEDLQVVLEGLVQVSTTGGAVEETAKRWLGELK